MALAVNIFLLLELYSKVTYCPHTYTIDTPDTIQTVARLPLTSLDLTTAGLLLSAYHLHIFSPKRTSSKDI